MFNIIYLGVYTLSNTILYPDDSSVISHTLTLQLIDTEEYSSVSLYLLNSKKGFRYKIGGVYPNPSRQYLFVDFDVDSQTTENADIDYLEVVLNNKYTQRVSVQIRPLKKSIKSFQYGVNQRHPESNLLSSRNKLASHTWSTVAKNDISNTAKLLEPLHSVYSNTYSKVNSYLKTAYSSELSDTTERVRVQLPTRPFAVYIDHGEYNEEMVEALAIESAIKDIKLERSEGDNYDVELYSVFLERYSKNSEELDTINSDPNVYLYFRNNRSNPEKFNTCIIKGINSDDEQIEERILTRYDIYTRTRYKYKTVFEIETNEYVTEVSNYVDLHMNHYVINEPYLMPPIVDSNNYAFNPIIRKESNESWSRYLLSIYSPLNDSTQPEYQFVFEDADEIYAIYVTDDLDVIYMSTDYESESTYINYSKLNIDYTLDLTNNVTFNNNAIVSVSNPHTLPDDWVDITIDTTSWFSATNEEVFLVQLKNKDTIYYLNAEDNTLVTEKTFIYKQTLTNTLIDFSIRIENTDPYLVTVLSADFKTKFVAGTYCHKIVPYRQERDNSSYSLVLYNNMLLNCYDYGEIFNIQPTDNITLDKVTIIFVCDDHSKIDFRFEFNNNYYIDNNSTNINEEYLRIDCVDDGFGTTVKVELDIVPLGITSVSIKTKYNATAIYNNWNPKNKITIIHNDLWIEDQIYPSFNEFPEVDPIDLYEV